MATVSLIVPCYNMEKYINQCIDSILAQTYKDIQLIIVNDGSTDSSESMIMSRGGEIDNLLTEFKYIPQINAGLGGACQTGFKNATGEYFMLLDSDDTILPESIEKQVEVLNSHPEYSAVRTNGYYVYEKENGIDKYLFEESTGINCKEEIWEDLFFARANALAGAYMVRMSILDEIYPNRDIYSSRNGQNLQFLFMAAYHRKTGYIDEPLVNYYIRTGSMSHDKNQQLQKQIQLIDGYKAIRRYIIENYLRPEEKSEYHVKMELMYLRQYILTGYKYHDFELLEKNYKRYLDLNGGKAEKDIEDIYFRATHPRSSAIIGFLHRAAAFVKRKLLSMK